MRRGITFEFYVVSSEALCLCVIPALGPKPTVQKKTTTLGPEILQEYLHWVLKSLKNTYIGPLSP